MPHSPVNHPTHFDSQKLYFVKLDSVWTWKSSIMVETNFEFLMKVIYWFAKYSFFIFTPMDCSKINDKFVGIRKFLISCGLSIIGYWFYDAHLETFRYIPSKILEFGINAILSFSIFVTILIKVNNIFAKDKFLKIFQNLRWCNNLVR